VQVCAKKCGKAMGYLGRRYVALGLFAAIAASSEATQRSRKALASSRKKIRTVGTIESELYPEIESSVKNSTGLRFHRADPTGEDNEDVHAEITCDYPTVKKNTLSSYAASVRPHKGGEPEKVTVGIDVGSIGNLDSKTQSLSVDMFLHMRWLDPRLQFPNDCRRIGVKSGETWQPDWYIANSAESMEKMKGMESSFMYPNGTVIYSVRIIGKIKCGMDFKKFPFDKQNCPIKIASTVLGKKQQLLDVEDGEPITYSVSKSKLGGTEWNFLSGSAHVVKASTPVPTPKRGEFHVEDPTTTKSRVDFSFGLSRFSDSYMKDFVIPVSMMFLMCWCGFVLNMKDSPPLPARAAIAIIPVLIMTTQTASSKQSIPRIDYTSWLSEMLSISLCFMVFGLLELVLVFYGCKEYEKDIKKFAMQLYEDTNRNWQIKKPKDGEQDEKNTERKWSNLSKTNKDNKIAAYKDDIKENKKDRQKPRTYVCFLRELDGYSLVVFPIAAILFACAMYVEAITGDE